LTSRNELLGSQTQHLKVFRFSDPQILVLPHDIGKALLRL